MYLRWVNYKCPSCQKRTESRIVTTPRAGVEYKKCRSCGATYRTPDIEWQHMTTAQRVNYFLNEWAIAVLGISIVCAVGVFYADRSDWKVPAIIVGVGAACCAPFWLMKVLAVKRSIRRTSTLSAQQAFGDIQAVDNLSQAGTFSAQTTLPATTPTPPPPAAASAKGRFSWGWKIRLFAIGAGILVAVLDSQWKTIDKYFPQLNKVLHAGTPTSDADLDYNQEHLIQDAQKVLNACPENTPFKECRAGVLANQAALDDLHQRVQALSDAWVKETGERTVPADCKTAMNAVLNAYNQLLNAEDQEFSALRSINPDSRQSLIDNQGRLDAIAAQEESALQVLRNNKTGQVCNGY